MIGKICRSIFAFYILALTLVPCIDGLTDVSMDHCSVAQSGHRTQLPDGDHCSPFCTCTCCVSPVVSQDNPVILKNYSISHTEYRIYSFISLPAPPSGIWEPPKIATLS